MGYINTYDGDPQYLATRNTSHSQAFICLLFIKTKENSTNALERLTESYMVSQKYCTIKTTRYKSDIKHD